MGDPQAYPNAVPIDEVGCKLTPPGWIGGNDPFSSNGIDSDPYGC